MSTKKKQLQQYQVEKILQKRNIVLFYQCSNLKIKEWDLLKKILLNTLSNNISLMASAHPPRSNLAIPFVTLLAKNRLGRRCGMSVKFMVKRQSLTNGKAIPEDSISVPILGQQERKLPRQPLLSASSNVCKSSCDIPIEEKRWSNLFQGPTLLFACNSHHQMVAAWDIINRNTNPHNSTSLLGGVYHGKTMTHLDLARICKLDDGVYTSLTCSLTESIQLLLDQRLGFYQFRLLSYLDCHVANVRSAEDKLSIALPSTS